MSIKKVLIISPHFAPSNAADMHRIRTSLPYFKEFGWEAEVVCVEDKYSEIVKDELLLQSVPADIKFHYVGALSKKLTSKLGLGSLALRSLPYYRKKINELLKKDKYDLIYFSTTQFPLCILGAYWKKRFGVPYVIDMQDPWHSEYYQDKPKAQRPPKYWFSYNLHKRLEPIAMKQADGLISVSEYYIEDLKARYAELKDVPASTITFGAFEPDLEIATENQHKFSSLLQPGFVNIVYVGRGGFDMHKAIIPVFEALKKGLNVEPELFGNLKFYFIGTSYAPQGTGEATILPLAKTYGVENSVIEITDRISYYHTLATLQQADALFIPGSDDPRYTASKIYPYLLTKKPLLAFFNAESNAIKALTESVNNAIILTFTTDKTIIADTLYQTLSNWGKRKFTPLTLLKGFDNYSARQLTHQQTDLFNLAVAHHKW
ncbi:glycosyltransferase [Mucilaginibacter sp.]|uniref:glycosyltransferase n=1 Tax=Mucilaginibacter sp. TaxID=1882438 RepID=UPI003D15148F